MRRHPKKGTLLFDYTSLAMRGQLSAPGMYVHWRAILLVIGFQLVAASCQATQTERADARKLNNLGVAYMNQQLMGKALELFQGAIAADDRLAVPHLNAGIALMNTQKIPEARVQLERAAKLNPDNPLIWYNLGLLDRIESKTDAAQSDFAHVIQLDSGSADAHYFLGSTLAEQGQYARAAAEFKEALRLSPLHASAQFGLARALQRSGDTTAARNHLLRFQQITDAKLASPLGQGYGDQGAYSLAVEIRPEAPHAGPMIPVSFHALQLDQPPAKHGLSDSNTNRSGMCLIDGTGHGKPDLITLNNGIGFYRQQPNGDYKRGSAEQHGLRVEGDPIACAVGDFDNDGYADLAVTTSSRLMLFHNDRNDTFSDITEKAGLENRNLPAGLTFVDFDHDGDLDLLVAGTARDGGDRGGNVLWRNNGNQTFTDWTAEAGLRGTGATVMAMLSDINNDRAVDLMTAGDDGVEFYLNQREGEFLRKQLSTSKQFAGAVGVAVFDFNKDGWMDVAVTHKGSPTLSLWRNVDGTHFERVEVPTGKTLRGWGVTPVDFDNDGWIDLAYVADTAEGAKLRLLRNMGTGHFEDVSAQVGLDKIRFVDPRSILAADVDGDGDADLLVSSAGSEPMVLRNDGGNRNHSIQIRLLGLADNKTALGAKVEIFSDGIWQKWEVAGEGGPFGQSSPSILAGLGASSAVDIIRILWPTGVPQDEIQPKSERLLEITELDRRGSSCPVLFAWNGKEYEFIADTIGAAVIGHWISPKERNTPDPDEWIKVSGSQLKPYRGRLSLRFGEPMEEVNYLDQVRLVAVDHPEDTEVFPNERFVSDPPFVEEKTIVTRAAHPPTAAWDDAGNSVLDLIRDRDRRYLSNFKNLSFAGFTAPHSLTLDLGNWSPARPLMLLLTGYIEYFSANSLYASSQAGLNAISPYVEARMPDGTWKKVIADMGFPAGLTRTMVADLTGRIPAGTREIRITTNLQIYWDQILINNDGVDPSLLRETEAPLLSASLAFRGYPKQVEGETPGDLTYHYSDASETGPFVRQHGPYTRYGKVTSLLASVDDQYAIFGTGEDIDLEFDDTRLPPIPKGWKRDYFFYANGYVKDMDYYEAMPYTVSAMPFHAMSGYPYSQNEHFPRTSSSIDYQLRWNDRMESDRPPASYQFRYHSRVALPDTSR